MGLFSLHFHYHQHFPGPVVVAVVAVVVVPRGFLALAVDQNRLGSKTMVLLKVIPKLWFSLLTSNLIK